MADTKIEWTEATWNPVTGCDRVSPGCDHCYALTMARRLKAMGQPRYQRDGDHRTSGPGFGVTVHPDVVHQPLRWRKPRRIFVNSMSDLFHADVPAEFVARVFAVMALTPQHTYQVLTKRHARMRSLLTSGDFERAVGTMWMEHPRRETYTPWPGWPLPNLWLGVSAEDQQWADLRIPHLLATPAAVRWVSMEPLLGPIDLCNVGPGRNGSSMPGWDALRSIPHLDWVVVGGESGPGARPMDLDAAANIVVQCRDAGVPVFVKQLGTVAGGKTHHDITTFPEALRVRQYPQICAAGDAGGS